ncbi:hypothetical protein CVV65_13600 [Kyrpidia spormannii]|uniref:HNH endonuclease n=1 Tax=Kyrpidia spormannii TaxID=2055160 RepID=A0A2K8N931_9BACL|nr:HNH endonuclease signature motif containing protein [Kyrpidia spormannii]ATY85834.1 hypothetical protein CVV65_13600 [Kyrpidia spormannii]
MSWESLGWNYDDMTARRRIRLKSPAPECFLCGERNPHTLEIHHVEGNHRGPTVLLCRNCHAVVTAKQVAGLDDLKRLKDSRRKEVAGLILMADALGDRLRMLAGMIADKLDEIGRES